MRRFQTLENPLQGGVPKGRGGFFGGRGMALPIERKWLQPLEIQLSKNLQSEMPSLAAEFLPRMNGFRSISPKKRGWKRSSTFYEKSSIFQGLGIFQWLEPFSFNRKSEIFNRKCLSLRHSNFLVRYSIFLSPSSLTHSFQLCSLGTS